MAEKTHASQKLHALLLNKNTYYIQPPITNPGLYSLSPRFPSISPHQIPRHHGRVNDWPCHPPISHHHEDANLRCGPVRCPSRRCCSATEHRSIWPALAENLRYCVQTSLPQSEQPHLPPTEPGPTNSPLRCDCDLLSTLGDSPEIHHSSKGHRTKTRGCFSQLDRTAAELRANATSNRNGS